MTQEFVSHEQAFKLKQLGFDGLDGLCFGYWNIDPCFKTPFLNFIKPFNHEWCLPAPTFSQAFRWFREKYGLHHCIMKMHDYFFDKTLGIHAETYEEAELACLNKLIEIVESNTNSEEK
jgi:hypothetical protein